MDSSQFSPLNENSMYSIVTVPIDNLNLQCTNLTVPWVSKNGFFIVLSVSVFMYNYGLFSYEPFSRLEHIIPVVDCSDVSKDEQV